MEFNQIFKAPSIPKLSKRTISSPIIRGAAKSTAIKLNKSTFSFTDTTVSPLGEGTSAIANTLNETNRILVEIQKQLALDFANRIAQEEDQIKAYKKEKEKKQRISKEKSIEGINKVGKTITGIFGFVTRPIKSIFDRIKEFFSIILTGIVLNNVFNWLEDPKNRKKVGDVFGFLVENWKIFAGILVGGLALRALYKIIRLVRAVKGLLRFLRILPQKPTGGAQDVARRGGLFRTGGGARRGITTQSGIETRTLQKRGIFGETVKYDAGVTTYTRNKSILGKTLQTVEVLTAKAGSDILKKIGLGPGAKGILGFLRPIFKRIPVFGALMDFALSLALGEPIGRAAAKAIGAALGGALGTLVPIPGVGTVAGGILGDLAGGAIYDAIVGKGKSKNNDEPPKYALGGKIKGPSHAAGGVPLLAEGEEFIVKKREVPRYEPLLQDINENGGRLWDEFIAGVKRQKSINDMSFATVSEFEELLGKYKEIVKADEERLKRKQNENPRGGTGGPTNPNMRINTSNVSNLVGKAGIQQPSSIAPPAPSYNVSMSQPNVSVQNISPKISIVPFSTRDLKPVKSGVNVVTLPPIHMNAGADASNLKLPSYNTGQQEYPSIVPYDVSNEYLNKAAFEYDIEGLTFGS